MKLTQALRLSNSPFLALTGAGGKTTALFQLASELAPAIVTTTTHLGVWQGSPANRHFIISATTQSSDIQPADGVTLVTGMQEDDRFKGLDNSSILWLRANRHLCTLPLLVEADGARGKPLKAPADYEPVIPDSVDTVVVLAGLGGLGKELSDEFVHRPDNFARLSRLTPGNRITGEAILRVLTHPSGGIKNIPPGARRIVLLNQADTADLQAQGKMLSESLLYTYDAIVVASLQQTKIHAVYERVAGIILAAGEAKRFGRPKQLLEYHGQPFVRAVAQTALAAGLSPVVVVTGANAEQVEPALKDLPVKITRNEQWQKGQSTSIQKGLQLLASASLALQATSPTSYGKRRGQEGAAIFLLADQPQVTSTLLRALLERHSRELDPVVAPEVRGQRANPVLFDRCTFLDLMAITGDVGGRAIFSKHMVTNLPWHDEILLADIDTPEDLLKLD